MHHTNKSPLCMCGLSISHINHAMNEETKMARSQCASADGFKSLLYKYTPLPWIPAWFVCKPALGEIVQRQRSCVWAVILHWCLGFNCLGSLWPCYPRYQRIEFICFLPNICRDSVSTGRESISFPVEVRLTYEPLLWSFIPVLASYTVMNIIQRWHDPSEGQHGEVMNKDEDSSF